MLSPMLRVTFTAMPFMSFLSGILFSKQVSEWNGQKNNCCGKPSYQSRLKVLNPELWTQPYYKPTYDANK